MDFMRLLKSLEELLYELVSWLVFYPVTLWRSLVSPQRMMRYADLELGDAVEDQYTDTLSPPLFLLITLLASHGLELALLADDGREALPAVFASDANLLIFRAVVFSVFPLLMAVKLLRHRGIVLDRRTLKPPFYSQCYVAAPFAFGLSAGTNVLRTSFEHSLPLGIALIGVSLAWYVQAEIRWFAADLKIGRLRAAFMVVRALVEAVLLIVAAAVLIGLGMQGRPA